jgi:hypothetical protein
MKCINATKFHRKSGPASLRRFGDEWTECGERLKLTPTRIVRRTRQSGCREAYPPDFLRSLLGVDELHAVVSNPAYRKSGRDVLAECGCHDGRG